MGFLVSLINEEIVSVSFEESFVYSFTTMDAVEDSF